MRNTEVHEVGHDILRIENVRVEFSRPRRGFRQPTPFVALDNVGLHIGANETVGLVGESGSGKTTLTRVILGLLRPVTGTAVIDGHQLDLRSGGYPQALHRTVQVVFQDPYSSLNPAMTVGDLIGEGITLHFGIKGSQRAQQVNELLDAVRLPRHMATRRPTQLSGGQRQRVSLARALAPRPRLLLLDEPVSSLDAMTQRQVVELLAQLQQERGVAYLFVGHDLGLINEISDRVVVLYQGRLMESGSAAHVWNRPAHPYTQGLMAAVPVADPIAQQARRAARRNNHEPTELREIAGQVPLAGCSFAPRCAIATDRCQTEAPTWRQLSESPSTMVACHHA
jgi:oligopeptide/dipeptide ABC transporter ATP-binding protein